MGRLPRDCRWERPWSWPLDANPGLQAVRNDLLAPRSGSPFGLGALLPPPREWWWRTGRDPGSKRIRERRWESWGRRSKPSYHLSNYGFSLNYTLNGKQHSWPRPRPCRKSSRPPVPGSGSEEATLHDLDVTQRYLDAPPPAGGAIPDPREAGGGGVQLRLAGPDGAGSGSPWTSDSPPFPSGEAAIRVLQAETAVRTPGSGSWRPLGVDPRPDLELTTGFEVAFPEWSADELIALAIDGNPGLAALRAGTSAAEVGVRSARTAYLPTISLSAGISGFARQATDSEFLVDQARASVQRSFQACESQNELYSRLNPPLPLQDCSRIQFTEEQANRVRATNEAFPFDFTRQPASLSLRLSLPLFQGLSRQRQVEAARVARDDSRLRVRQEEIRLRAEVTAALDAVETARASAELEEQNVALADEQLRLAQEQYRVGSASFLQLVEAETLKARADRELVAAVFAFHDTVAALEALVGASLRTR